MPESGTYDQATERRRRLAELMLADSMKVKPIQHWAQGLAQLGQAAVGGLVARGVDEEAKDNEAALARTYAGLLGGGAAPAAAPAASPQSTPTGGAPMVTAPMGNKVAAAMGPRPVEVSDLPIDGPSPLDPPSGADRDKVIRTMLAEAGNQGPQGMNAVASVVRNRAVNGETTPSAVVQAPNQFEPWNTQAGRQKMASIDPNSPQYAAAAQALESAYAGNDPTGGATHFYAPKAQAALGRPAPAWDNGKGVDIGDHRFFGGNPVAQAMSAPAPAAPPPAPAQGDIRAQIAGMLTSQNPAERRLGMQLAQASLAQQMKPQEYGFQTQPDGTILRTNPRTGQVEPIYQGATKPTFGVIGKDQDGKETYGFIDAAKGKVTPLEPPKTGEDRGSVAGPDGKPIPIPPGVDRKTFVNEVSRANAKAAAGEKTEVQAKSEKFGNKMELAEHNLKDIEGELQSYKGRSLEGAPLVGNTMATNWAQSEKYQQAAQARNNFITALLRDESGAAIGTDEFKRYEKELFPQPGDSAKVVEQKREARRVAIEGMKKAAGPGYKPPTLPKKDAGEAPEGVDPNIWKHMTPEERALWK